MTEVEIHCNVKVNFVICELCKKHNQKYLIQIHFCNFLFLLCFILCILRGEKNQKLLSRFLCCKSSVLVHLNVFMSWLKSRDLFSSSSVQQGNTTQIIFVTYCWRIKHFPYIIYSTKVAEEVCFVISSSLLVSFAIVSIPYHFLEAKHTQYCILFMLRLY